MALPYSPPILHISLECSVTAAQESLNGPCVSHMALMVQNYSSPGFEVCDTETVCGVESHTAVAHDAAQQGPQIR